MKITLGSLCFFGLAAVCAMRSGYLRINLHDEDEDNEVNHSGNHDFCIVLHGGAGVISKNLDSGPYKASLSRIIANAYNMAMTREHTALDLAEYVVTLLEDEHLFNAGKGAVYTSDETHELEAALMDGSNLKCGAVSLVKSIRNPISLARAVMDHTKYCYMVSDEAFDELADRAHLERVDQAYYGTQRRLEQVRSAKKLSKAFLDHDLDFKQSTSRTNSPLPTSCNSPLSLTPLSSSRDSYDGRFSARDARVSGSSLGTGTEDNINKWHPSSTGTVGCVVMYGGHVSAATSTGGLTNKPPGRIGDTPVIGAGTYANDLSAAISATGKGEELLRHCIAHDVHARITMGRRSLLQATRESVFDVLPEETGGLITVNAKGEYAMEFNSKGMFRAVCSSKGVAKVGIWEDMVNIDIRAILEQALTEP
jgi:beta-aspartyl-peptidase (threonine type)